jgi:hypothetical protein
MSLWLNNKEKAFLIKLVEEDDYADCPDEEQAKYCKIHRKGKVCDSSKCPYALMKKKLLDKMKSMK